MANTKLIKSKIKSVNNLQKIVKALEIVSTIKLQKLKYKTQKFKDFMSQFLGVLYVIKDHINLFSTSSIDTPNHYGKRLIVVVTSDKGLCGSINNKLIKHLHEKYGTLEDAKKNVDLFVVGKKGLDFFVSTGWNVVGTLHIKDSFVEEDLNSLFVYIKQSLQQKKYAKIKIYFNYFKNVVVQTPLRFKIYPLDQNSFDAFLENIDLNINTITPIKHNYILFEPNRKTYIRSFTEQIIHHIVYYAIINNKTSEQASRMIAMKNAKDNCQDIVSGLQIIYNKTRQQKITQEISEIVSGSL